MGRFEKLRAVKIKILKEIQGSWEIQVLSFPLQLVLLGVDRPCIFQAKEQQRPVGLEQEVEELHLQVVAVVAAAAAAVEEDTCH